MNYQLLILRTHRQFTGRVWFAYDHAFREHAAATNLTDWSSINVQLFNFHAAGAAVRAYNAPVDGSPEPRGSASLTIVCKSWNRGRVWPPMLHAVSPILVRAVLARIVLVLALAKQETL